MVAHNHCLWDDTIDKICYIAIIMLINDDNGEHRMTMRMMKQLNTWTKLLCTSYTVRCWFFYFIFSLSTLHSVLFFFASTFLTDADTKQWNDNGQEKYNKWQIPNDKRLVTCDNDQSEPLSEKLIYDNWLGVGMRRENIVNGTEQKKGRQLNHKIWFRFE